MAAVCGNKHLRLPFSGKLINQPLHTDMAEMIFRLLKQQYVELSLLLMPLQLKLRFDGSTAFLFHGDEWKYRPR